MAGSTNCVQIGVIEEEYNDVEVLDIVTGKLIPANRFKFKHFVAHGCGKLRLKCQKWAENLLSRGCTHLVVIHDLDTTDKRKEPGLRQLLEQAIRHCRFRLSVVLIPIEELEAWLLTDPGVIKRVFNMRKVPRIPRDAEAIGSPKEFLADLVERNSKSEYVNTIHNRKIANELSLAALNRCSSFARYPAFIKAAVKG